MRSAHRTRDDNSFIAVPPCLPPDFSDSHFILMVTESPDPIKDHSELVFLPASS